MILPIGNGAAFICLERATANRFTIPQYVLSNIPATPIPVGVLGVSGTGPQVKFSATGLDAGYLSYTVGVGKNVTFAQPTPKM